LRVSRAKHDDATLDWSGLTRLEFLSIDMTPLKDADLASLGKLTHLKALLGLVGISDAGLANLAGLTELQRLDMGDAKLTNEGLRHLENMRKLDLLVISGSFTSQGLESLEGLRALRTLMITSAAPLSEQALARLQGKLPNLTRLTAGAAGG
jgi:hypothetical protein